MPIRALRSAIPGIVALTAVAASPPAFAREKEGGPPGVTAESPVVLWGSAAGASGKQRSAATFELPVGTSCHAVGTQEPVPRWSCELGGATVSGFARRAAFTKSGLPRVEPESAFWTRLRRYSGDWVECMRREAPSEDCGQTLKLRLNLFWAARLAEAAVATASADSGVRTLQCPLMPEDPKCLGNACEGECFSKHLGAGRLIGAAEGAVFVQPAEKDSVRLFAATSKHDEDGGAMTTLPPMTLLDPMLVPLLSAARSTEALEVAVDVGRKEGTFLQPQANAPRFRAPRRLDGHQPFVVCDTKIVRPKLERPARVLFEELMLPDVLFPVYEYALPCASSLVLGEQVPGIQAGAKSTDRFGSPPKMTAGPEGKSLSAGPLTLRGEPASEAGRLKRCTIELEGLSERSYRSCGALYAGDLNGDGKEDFVLDLRGESGCGGATLFLSTPTGWTRVVENDDYC